MFIAIVLDGYYASYGAKNGCNYGRGPFPVETPGSVRGVHILLQSEHGGCHRIRITLGANVGPVAPSYAPSYMLLHTRKRAIGFPMTPSVGIIIYLSRLKVHRPLWCWLGRRVDRLRRPGRRGKPRLYGEAMARRGWPRRLKPPFDVAELTARLKPRPFKTKSRPGFFRRLKPRPFKTKSRPGFFRRLLPRFARLGRAGASVPTRAGYSNGEFALANIADDENHSRPQGCYILVIVLQG